MQISFGFFLILSFVLASCQSTKVPKPPVFVAETESSEKSALTLEQVAANWEQSMVELASRDANPKLNWQEELTKICVKQDSLCEYGVKSSKKKDLYNKKVSTEIKKNLEEENFDSLSNYSVQISLKFFGPFKNSKLMGYADHLLRDTTCRTVDMKHALASALEDYLPDHSAKLAVQALYEANSECPSSKTMAMSAYRAAMLRLLDQDCAKATPLLDKVSISTEDYLKPRALYWSWRCQGQPAAVKAAADTQLPYFSYHRILMDESTSLSMPQGSLLLGDQTPVLVETQKNPYLNEAARLAEKLMAAQMAIPARAVLERIRIERLQEAEPEFQVYWAHLLHLNLAGIRKFQVLSSLINNNPLYRTRAVQNMLFPNWFFEHVEAHSKSLDPWLVQSLIRQESAFDPLARSRVGATGLMQLMPATARLISRTTRQQLKDPVHNVQAGVRFLEKLVEKFDGQVPLALAAYNAGPLRVEEWKKRYPTDDMILFVDTIPYRETREYVAFILRNYYWYRSLNVTPPTVTTPPQSENKSWLSKLKVAVGGKSAGSETAVVK